jgi:hypothetical protein
MKIKSTKTTIEYAGRILVQPGGYFDGDAIADSLDSSAQAVSLVKAPFKRIEQTENASASRSFSFVNDFDTVDEAIAFKLQAEEHGAQNLKGDLTISVGENLLRTYEAGLTGLSSSISLAPSSVRVVLNYDFVTGVRKDSNSQS